MLSNPDAMDDINDEQVTDDKEEEEFDSGTDSKNNVTSGCESDLEKGLQDLSLNQEPNVIQEQRRVSVEIHESASNSRKGSDAQKIMLSHKNPSQSSHSSHESVNMMPPKNPGRKSSKGKLSETRSSSFVATTFSKDVVKIRPDLLKSIPLTTGCHSGQTITNTYTSASISSSDSGKSNFSLPTRGQLYRRRKSVSLDGG